MTMTERPGSLAATGLPRGARAEFGFARADDQRLGGCGDMRPTIRDGYIRRAAVDRERRCSQAGRLLGDPLGRPRVRAM
jgi:hypothetical protein